MKIIKCKAFGGAGVHVFVNADNISHFRSYEANGYHGSKIVMRDGNEILVGDYPEDVERKVADAESLKSESTRGTPHVLNG